MSLSTIIDCPASVGLLADAGVLDLAAVHTAARTTSITGVDDEREHLLIALAVRAPQRGHVAVAVNTLPDLLELQELADLAIEDRHVLATALGQVRDHVRGGPQTWGDNSLLALAGSDETASAPLMVEGDLVYLNRWHHLESRVVDHLARLLGDDAVASGKSPEGMDPDQAVAQVLAEDQVEQRRAALQSLRRRLVVVAGGPGTGKTWTVARVLAVHGLVADPGRIPTVALAAPTGKAAARLSEGVAQALDNDDLPVDARASVREMVTDGGMTLHRLLGMRPGRRPWHHPGNPLTHDLVIVDEASMVALPLMAQLLDALGPTTRLVLMGDPDQLASVEAGTVLGDVVAALADVDHPCVVTLQSVHRFGAESGIAALASSVRDNDVAGAFATLDTADDVAWIDSSQGLDLVREVTVRRGTALLTAATNADVATALEALDESVVLAPHHLGPLGIAGLNLDAESWLATADHRWRPWDEHQLGRPVLVTANDRLLGVYNGDLGVHVRGPEGDIRVAFDIRDNDGDHLLLHPDRLPAHQPVHAMTIHKSQGSQWRHVVIVVPERHSPLLTRQLLYTAVTRARERVTIVGSRETLDAAISTPIRRASGLRQRLTRTLAAS